MPSSFKAGTRNSLQRSLLDRVDQLDLVTVKGICSDKVTGRMWRLLEVVQVKAVKLQRNQWPMDSSLAGWFVLQLPGLIVPLSAQ
jgi:hypothetical protein